MDPWRNGFPRYLNDGLCDSSNQLRNVGLCQRPPEPVILQGMLKYPCDNSKKLESLLTWFAFCRTYNIL